MSLHRSKRNALLCLVNSLPPSIGAIQTFSELSDGKLFCDIIKIKFSKTQDKLPAQETQNVCCEEESKDDRLLDSVNSELENGKMICEDSKTESEDVIKKDSETIQESDTELVKFAVSDSEHTITPTKSASEFVIEPIKSVNRDGTSVFRNAESAIKQVKSSVSNSESLTKPPKSLDGDSKSVIEPVRSSDSDDISNRFKCVQIFIDEMYKLKSELVICYLECRNANELELAKVTIFIMSCIIPHYVFENNPIIQTLSLVDSEIQQDLEQCFSFFINNRNKITKENVHKLLSSGTQYKMSSTPRKCLSIYKSKPLASPSQENVYTDSPLKKFFDSPNFTDMTIVAKTKEIQTLTRRIFEEEDRRSDDVEQLQTALETKDKEINKLKKEIKRLNAEMRTEEKPKDCKDCKEKDEIIKKHTKILEKIMHKNETKCEECVKWEKRLGRLHTSFSMVKMRADHAMEKANSAAEDLEKMRAKVFNLELENKDLKEQYKKDVELSYTRNKRLESPEHDDTAIISSYTEGNENLHKEILQVQCLEQHIDFSGKNESNVSVPELLPVVDLPEDEKFQNSDKSANKECSNVSDVSTKLDVSKYAGGSPSTDVSLSKTLNTALSTDSTSVSSNQCNSSTSDYENADKVPLSVPLEIINKLENVLSEIVLHLSVSDPNGSNNKNLLNSQVRRVKEYLKYFKIKLCISQTAESQNNNSIAKDMTNETESCSREVYPNKKARIDDPYSNITTMNEECSDVYRKIQIDELEKKQKEIENFEKKLEKEQEEADNLKKELEEKQAEIDSLKKELDKKQEEIDSLKKELENKQEKIKNLKKEDINGLKRRLDKKQEEIDTLKKGIEEKQEEIKKLKKGKEDINSLKKRLEKKQEEIDSLKIELENEQEEIKNLKKEQEDINSLKKRLEKKGENIDSLKKGLQEKQEEIDSLKKGLKEKQEEIDSLKKGLEEEKETVDNLKNKLEEVSENLKLKKKDQKFWQEKYLHAKRCCKERLKLVEQNQQRFAMEFKDMKQRKNNTINRKNSENSSLKMDLNTMCRSQAKTAAELSACINKLKKLEEKNEQLHETIKNLEETKKDIDEEKKEAVKEKKEVEQKLEHTNALLKALSSKTSAENSLLPGIKGIKDEYAHLENTNDGFSKSKYISPSSTEITALDTGNESTLSCALYSRSFKGGLPFVNDDEEVFLNHSSIAEIHKDYESADVQENTRRQELKRRNTMCASHMQSTYAAEGIFLTPVDKKLTKYKKYKKSDVVKPEYHLDNNGHIRKKRKVSEVEAEDQSSKLLTTPAAKIRRTFKTPSSLHKLLQFKRIQRPGSIKPKP